MFKCEHTFDNLLRIVSGINDFDFAWELKREEQFETPELVMTYSNSGVNKMSQQFHDLYRNYLINEIDYIETRNNRIEFLTSIGIDKDVALRSVPDKYQEIPDFIWSDIIKNIIKKLEKMEDELSAVGLNEFAISGHTEGKKYYPWQMFDKSRYTLTRKK